MSDYEAAVEIRDAIHEQTEQMKRLTDILERIEKNGLMVALAATNDDIPVRINS